MEQVDPGHMTLDLSLAEHPSVLLCPRLMQHHQVLPAVARLHLVETRIRVSKAGNQPPFLPPSHTVDDCIDCLSSASLISTSLICQHPSKPPELGHVHPSLLQLSVHQGDVRVVELHSPKQVFDLRS